VASQATLAGVPLTVTARLPGHSDVRMTMRYAHVGDREIEAAAERVGQAVAAIMSQGRMMPGPSRYPRDIGAGSAGTRTRACTDRRRSR